MSPKEIKRTITALESIATSLTAIQVELRAKRTRAFLDAQHEKFDRLIRSAPGIEGIDPAIVAMDAKEAAKKLGRSVKTIHAHCDALQIDRNQIWPSNLDTISKNIEAAKARPHLTAKNNKVKRERLRRRKIIS